MQEIGLQRVYNERNMSLEALPNRDQGISVNGKWINWNNETINQQE